MLRWLASQFSSEEPEAEARSAPKSIRALVAELNAAPADRMVRRLIERFAEIPQQGLGALQSSRDLGQLDEYAQVRLPELWGALLSEARGQSVSDSIWDLLASFYRKLHAGYWHCLEHWNDSKVPARDDEQTMILASRAMTALGNYMLLLRMRYRRAPTDLWAYVNDLMAWAEQRGIAGSPIEQYPGTRITTTLERELLSILLVEAAPTANLLPAQIHVLNRFIRPYIGHNSISHIYDEQARPFAFDPSRNESPRRWLKGLQLRPGIRFFGIGEAYSELLKAFEDAKSLRSIPEWIGRTRCTVDDYRDLLNRLVAEWSPRPPSRSQLRESAPAEILVAHEWSDIRRLVTFGELARSGQSLMYDTSNIHSMTNTPLRGRSEVFRDFTDEEIMLANLQSFEQSLNHGAMDSWSLTDCSERGLGATAAAACAWLKVGMLIGWRRVESTRWEIAVIRRLHSLPNHRLSIGMTKLAGNLHAGRLRLGIGLKDYSRSIGRGDPDLEYDVLMLRDTSSTLLMPVGVVDTACKFTLHWNKRQDIVKMERSVDCGLNFERAEFSILGTMRQV